MSEAEQELAELRETFELRWAADQRAIARWRETTGKEDIWPDHADLVCYLLARLEAAEEEMSTEAVESQAPREWGSDDKVRATAALKWLSSGFGNENIKAQLGRDVVTFCEVSVPGERPEIGTGETTSEAAGRASLALAERLGVVSEKVGHVVQSAF